MLKYGQKNKAWYITPEGFSLEVIEVGIIIFKVL